MPLEFYGYVILFKLAVVGLGFIGYILSYLIFVWPMKVFAWFKAHAQWSPRPLLFRAAAQLTFK